MHRRRRSDGAGRRAALTCRMPSSSAPRAASAPSSCASTVPRAGGDATARGDEALPPRCVAGCDRHRARRDQRRAVSRAGLAARRCELRRDRQRRRRAQAPERPGAASDADFDHTMHANVLAPMRVLPQLATCWRRAQAGADLLEDGLDGRAQRHQQLALPRPKAAANSVRRTSRSRWAIQGGVRELSTPAGCAPTWAAPARTSVSKTAWPACAA